MHACTKARELLCVNMKLKNMTRLDHPASPHHLPQHFSGPARARPREVEHTDVPSR